MRPFGVVRDKDKRAVGRRPIDKPGYLPCVGGQPLRGRLHDLARLQRACDIEQSIEELKNNMHADGFCTRKFFATEAAMLSV